MESSYFIRLKGTNDGVQDASVVEKYKIFFAPAVREVQNIRTRPRIFTRSSPVMRINELGEIRQSIG